MHLNLLLAAALFAPPGNERPISQGDWDEHLQAIVADSLPAAQAALKGLDLLTTDDNFKSLGFATLAEVKSAKLGDPFPVVQVRLDELKDFKEGDDPLFLLHSLHRAVYPVMVDDEFRSALEIRRHKGKWELSSVGLTADVRRYAEGRRKHSAGEQTPAHCLVKIPALHQYCLGHRTTDKGLRLLRIRDETVSGRLDSRPAAEVFLDLVPFAREHDGKAR
jgi:hypothetical protein